MKSLSGVPWHATVVCKNDDRRHKNWCKFYNNKTHHCSYYGGDCPGSAHCTAYNNKHIVSLPLGQKVEELCKGDIIRHEYYGFGKVVRIKLERVWVKYDDFGVKGHNQASLLSEVVVVRRKH